MPPPDLRAFSDRDLSHYARDLAYRIAALEARIEPATASRKRTIKIVRSTVLMGGGLLAATLDLFALIITLLGVWDCIEAVHEDVATMNEQHELRRTVIGLQVEMDAIEAEFQRRGFDL